MEDRRLTAAAGLSSLEAKARLAQDGPNTIATSKHRTIPRIVASVLREPMLALLATGAVIYVLIGEPTDSAVLVGLALLSIAITVIQEVRTERALESSTARLSRSIRGGWR